MFSSVLVANRGEIALRVMRTCARLGIRTVAVYSDADWASPHVRAADEAVRIGAGPAAESYLRVEAVLDAARSTGAEALHPGYGFLSENAAFADACIEAGLVWVGPPAAAMRALGDKAHAKALAASAGVPILPGYHGEDASDAALREAAGGIGYPLLVKASAGGGGRGMRVVREPGELDEALAAARREAAASFGDDRLLLERYLERPRHVEVQVLADAHGAVVHLGERECSVQRRHQKLIEESPSPAVSAALRASMGEAALRLVRAAGYEGAGTVEFLLDARRGVLLPRGQRAAPGGAPGDRGRDRARPRRAAAAGRGRRAAGLRRRRTSASTGTRWSCGSSRRIRWPGSCRRRAS